MAAGTSGRRLTNASVRRLGGDEQGQSLVLVALWLTVLMGFAAVAIDVGRFYSERRFLQNAADAAALAAAQALTLGKTNAEAEQAARDSLAGNYAWGDPTGNPPPMPSLVPIYKDSIPSPTNLVDGILIGATDVRVAVRNPVHYTFGRVLGLVNQDIGAQARVIWQGGYMPIAVRQYVSPPGPSGNSAPCPLDQTRFMDFFATANTACLGTDTDASLRQAPNPGANFDPVNPDSDPTNHGPVVEILGQGAQPSNGSDFRGFVALDIRNFSSTTSRLYYNGVTSGMQQNVLKDVEAAWIFAGGYPGPDFPAVISPPDPNDQVGVMSGNSTGIAIDAINARFVPGDEILVLVYPGTVMRIPDFALSPPPQIALPIAGTVANAGSFKVSRNQAFAGTVDLSTIADTNDPDNPMTAGNLVGADPITYNPDPVTPSLGQGTTVLMQNITIGPNGSGTAAKEGIYTLWVKGQSGSPYLTTKHEPLAVKVGSVSKDFTMTSDFFEVSAANGADAVFTLTLKQSGGNYGVPVSLSVDSPLPAGAGAISFSNPSPTPSGGGAQSTLRINAGTMASGLQRFIVRATGMNNDSTPHKVTHLIQVYVNVNGTGNTGADEYVDISGFAVMRIATADSNTIRAYAITPAVSNPNDPILKRAKTIRLVPW